jgi:hypothetical protein
MAGLDSNLGENSNQPFYAMDSYNPCITHQPIRSIEELNVKYISYIQNHSIKISFAVYPEKLLRYNHQPTEVKRARK